MMNLEQKKKEFLFKLGKSLEATEEKRDKPENLTFKMVREKLSRSFFAEIENKKTGEFFFDTRDKLDIFLSILSGEKQKTGVLKNLYFNNANINIYTINKEDLDNISDKITYFLLAENYGTCEKGIRGALTEAFNKAEPLTFSKSMLEKAENFQNSFSKFENAFKEYKNKYNFDIIKEEKKVHYEINFFNKKNETEAQISSKDLKTFINRTTDFLKGKISNETLNKLKTINLKDLKTETAKNFELSCDDTKLYRLKIESKENVYIIRKKWFTDIALNLTNDNYSELLDNRSSIDFFKKIDYLKEENKTLSKILDKNIKKETFKEIENDVIYRSVFDYAEKNRRIPEEKLVKNFRKENLFANIKKEIESIYETRVMALNGQEKIETIKRSRDYFENGFNFNLGTEKILETVKNKIFEKFETEFNDILERVPKFCHDIDLSKIENENEKSFILNHRTFKVMGRVFASDLKAETIDIQREISKNSTIFLSVEKGLDNEEIYELDKIFEVKEVPESQNIVIIKEELYKDFVKNYLENNKSFDKAPTKDFFLQAFEAAGYIHRFDMDQKIKVPLTETNKITKKLESVEQNSKKKLLR